MAKKEEYQNKLLSDLYTKEQILAVILFFFRKVDDLDYSIIESIIKRRLGLLCGTTYGEKPLHESIDDLSDHIVVKAKETIDTKTTYIYEAPTAKGIERSMDESIKYFCTLGEVIDIELYRMVEDISKDSLELTLRRLSVDPEFSNITNGVEGRNIKSAKRKGLLKARDYQLSEKGIQDLANKEELEEIIQSISECSLTGVPNEKLLAASTRGFVVKKSAIITERGRVYLLAKEYEDQIQQMKNILFGVQYCGNYLEEYLTHIYREEMQGFHSFVSRLDWKWYVYYCNQNGYDDSFGDSLGDSKDHGAKVYPKPTKSDDKK